MRDNYAPWAIKIENFPEKGSLDEQLKFLLGFAILAPSWTFMVSEVEPQQPAEEFYDIGKISFPLLIVPGKNDERILV